MVKNHPQVYVDAPLKSRVVRVHVDRGIAGFLQQMWDRGISTVGSCQEFRPGLARIWFRYGADFAEFMRLYPEAESEGALTADFPKEYLNEPLRQVIPGTVPAR